MPCSFAADVIRTETTKYSFSPEDHAFLEQVARGCFNYLWSEVGMPAQLAKDRRTTLVASVAGVGFQLSSLPIGVERGWITRDQGMDRALAVLRAIENSKEVRREGVLLHFVTADSARTFMPFHNEASTVDHALFLAGALPAASYFGGEVAEIVSRFVAQTNWRAYQADESGILSMGWKCDFGQLLSAGRGRLISAKWHVASDEERIIYFLAAGCPTKEFAVDPGVYYKLSRQMVGNGTTPDFVGSNPGTPFTYFFSHCWIDYRSLGPDNPSEFGEAGPRVDWFENSRRAILSHRAECINQSTLYPTLGPDRWGLSPCMGQAGDHPAPEYLVQQVPPKLSRYTEWHRGTVAPYAAGASIMFTPTESLAALRAFKALRDKKGRALAWRDPADGGYGFPDSFNLEQDVACDDNVAIDVGPMLLGIENARSGLIWKLFMQHPVAQRAVERLKLEKAE